MHKAWSVEFTRHLPFAWPLKKSCGHRKWTFGVGSVDDVTSIGSMKIESIDFSNVPKLVLADACDSRHLMRCETKLEFQRFPESVLWLASVAPHHSEHLCNMCISILWVFALQRTIDSHEINFNTNYYAHRRRHRRCMRARYRVKAKGDQ